MSVYYAVTYSPSIEHHGIKGQKWGIRRYRNYDGSYTQAGLRRYRVAEANYEHSKEKYKKAKAEYKNRRKNGYSDKELEETRKNLSIALYKGPNGLERGTKDYYKTASKRYLTNFKLGSDRRKLKNARAEMREDRRTRNKYYRHLHDDYMADKGKERYARGERISTRGKVLANIASGAGAAVMLMKYRGVYRRDVLKATAALAIGSAAAYTMINAYAELPMGNNAQLRKYYSHKSLPDLKDKTKTNVSKEPKQNLSTRFDRALKDNPNLTYDKIYKDMKIDTSSEDTTLYKKAEDEWLKKHGY